MEAKTVTAKEVQSQATRQRLIEAASDLFAERGYVGASVGDVAERSGISRGSIGWHFGSKDGLLWAVIEAAFGQWETKVLIPEIDQSTGIEAIRHGLAAHRRFLEEDRPRLRLFHGLMGDAIGPQEDLRQRYAELHEHLRGLCQGWIEDGQRKGEIRSDVDARATVTALIGAVGGIAYQALLDPELELDEIYAALTAMACDGLTA